MGVQSWDRGAAAGANEGEEVCVTAYYIKIGMMQKRRKSDDGGEGALLEPRSSGGGGGHPWPGAPRSQGGRHVGSGQARGLMLRQSPGRKLSQAVHLLREVGGENKG